MRLQYHGYEVSTVMCSGLTGQPGSAGFVLAFFLTFQPKQIPQLAHVDCEAREIRDLRLRVSVQAAKRSMVLGVVGCLEQAFLRVDQYGHQDTKRFELFLSEGQLAAIEQARGTGGLVFDLELFATATGNKGAEYTKAEFKYERNLVDWTKLLREFGASEYMCVPVAMPQVGSENAHTAAVKWLRSAQKFMQQGEFAAAIGECRHVLEKLTVVNEEAVAAVAGDAPCLDDEHVLSAYVSRKERRAMTRGQRLVLVRMAVFHLTNIAHHPGGHPEQTLSREDASLVLASTAALVSASVASRFDSETAS